MKKTVISENRLREIISEEALRMKKRLTLESEKKQLIKRLSEMYKEEEEEEGEEVMDEGLMSMLGLKDEPAVVQQRKDKIMAQVDKAKAEGWVQKWSVDGEIVDEAGFMKAMEKNGYTGKLIGGAKYKQLNYSPGRYGASRLGAGGASQGLGI